MRNHRPHWAQSTGPRPGFILIKYALPWLRVVSARDGGLRCAHQEDFCGNLRPLVVAWLSLSAERLWPKGAGRVLTGPIRFEFPVFVVNAFTYAFT